MPAIPMNWFARENAIVVNNLLLCSAFGAVFIGTFYPMLAELTGGGQLVLALRSMRRRSIP